ncbi:MAG: S8 family serine peptidase [Candidatus Bipolaricaulota bacterium]|nr:S8 family serine peptidase [Candidatus Bipolaricaulota bacterium]MCS7274854.1 S8 family serine peptidase [Candidatus Bipolaricaulota bacterium]MDW8111275.1 S8 family serine peptidase [Candidatus Bipolaricaulota bacterium]MDW8328589.1 S8 family serine peptidase [Candidatus Bipolaricaulota bacterium]
MTRIVGLALLSIVLPLLTTPTQATDLLAKLDSRLEQLATLYETEGLQRTINWAYRMALDDEVEGERVRVEIELQLFADRERFLNRLRAQGALVEVYFERFIQALVPLRTLKQIAQQTDVRFVQAPITVDRDQGSVISEGVFRSGAHRWHEAGFKGAGAKIVIIDTGFEGYRKLLGSELPQEVIARSFRSDGDIEAGERHGTAVAELVHDMAPHAQLLLTNIRTRTEWGRAVEWAIEQGATGITSSLSSPPECHGDSRTLGSVARRARERGILWTTSAGNLGANHWGGPWRDDDQNDILNFTETDETINIRVTRDQSFFVVLTWDDPCGQSANDYDLFLLDAQGQVVARSTNIQNGSGIPTERIDYRPAQSGLMQIQVRRKPGAKPVTLDIYNRYVTQMEYVIPAGSIQDPGLSPYIMAIGAINVHTGTLESFSSRGPTRDGRPKPDISGHNRVSTQTYGSSGFAGTSASTPQVAGAAALIKSAFPAWTPEQIQQFLEVRAEDRGAPGKDSEFGAGELFLGEASLAVGVLDLSTTVLAFQATENQPDPEPQTLTIRNAGLGTIDWQIEWDAPWLQVSPASGSTPPPATVTVEVKTNGLAPGRYETRLLVTAPAAANSPQVIRLTLDVRAAARQLVALQFTQLVLLDEDKEIVRRLENGCVRYMRAAGTLRLQTLNSFGSEEHVISATVGALVCRESVLFQSLEPSKAIAKLADGPRWAVRVLKVTLGDPQGWQSSYREGCFVFAYTLSEPRAIQAILLDNSPREFTVSQGSELLLCGDVLHIQRF